MTFEGRVILITGATGGLGRVVAREAAAGGARLALASSSEESLADLVATLDLPAARVRSAAGDLRRPKAAAAAVAAAIDAFGRLDVVVHVVGGWIGGKPIVETRPEDLTTMIDQHLWTTFNVFQAAVPRMVPGGWGRLVSVTSPVGGAPSARSGPYSVAKAAQEALFATLAREVAGTGVTANVIVVKAIDVDHARELAPTPKNAAWVTPEEITAAIHWLCSDEAGMVNGARIPLTGTAARGGVEG